jgi:anti-anti-sigma factor
MNISVQAEHVVPVLVLEGRLDAVGASALDIALTPLLAGGRHIALDLTQVAFLSSVGIRSLLVAEKALRAGGKSLWLAGVKPQVLKVLETSGLARSFRFFPTADAAIASAVADDAAAAGATTRVVNGRTYTIGARAAVPCALDVWGALDEVPDDPIGVTDVGPGAALLDATLDELSLAFGTGGLGTARSQGANTLGAFVAVGHLAGVAMAGGVSDFALSDRPAEEDVAIAGAIGFTGPASLVVDLATPDAVRVADIARDLTVVLDLHDQLAGFQISTDGWLMVGAFPGADPGRLRAHAFVCDGVPKPPLTLEAITGVTRVDPDTEIRNAAIAVYLPTAVRLGTATRLAIEIESGVALRDEWTLIIRRLYHDCSRVILTQLVGGYMATTYRVASFDRDGRRLLPTVLKISTLDQIDREGEAHGAYVARFILNNSTTIMGTAREGDWAALRYNFLGVSGADARLTWLTHHYQTRSTDDVLALFDRLYTKILKPWYGQPRWEPIRLYADHSPLGLFPKICEEAERQFGWSAEDDRIECPELGTTLVNPFKFLKYEYPARAGASRDWFRGITHGDLNPRNVLVDEHENLYVIDFSETRLRNIVSDFARMEAVLKFDLAPLENQEDLEALTEYEAGLAEAATLGDIPPNRYRGARPDMTKIHALICRLRRYANEATLDEIDIVPYWIACLEWTFSVICYDLPLPRKRLAGYSAAILCGKILEREPA